MAWGGHRGAMVAQYAQNVKMCIFGNTGVTAVTGVAAQIFYFTKTFCLQSSSVFHCELHGMFRSMGGPRGGLAHPMSLQVATWPHSGVVLSTVFLSANTELCPWVGPCQSRLFPLVWYLNTERCTVNEEQQYKGLCRSVTQLPCS